MNSLVKSGIFYLMKRLDYDKIFSNIVDIIIYFDNLDIKCQYFILLCEISKNQHFFVNNLNIVNYVDKIYNYSNLLLYKLKNAKNNCVKDSNKIKVEQQIVCFLQFLSNCAINGKNNQQLIQFLSKKEIDDILLSSLQHGKELSYNILTQVVCTLANFYQNE